MIEPTSSKNDLKFEPNIFKAVIDTIIDGVVVINASGIIQLINPSIVQMFGYKEDELIGVNVKILMPEPDSGNHDQYLKNYLRTGKRKIIGIGREVTARRKDGSQFPILLSISEATFKGEKFFAGILHDITELIEMREQVRESEMRMLHLSQNLPVGAVYRIGEEIHLNKRIQELTGYGDGEISSLKDWFQALMGDKWEDYYEIYQQDRRRNFTRVRTYKIITKTGETKWVDFAAFKDSLGEVWILHDVTQKVQTESELLLLNEELEKRVGEKTIKLRESVLALEEANKKLQERETELKNSLDKERELNELKSRFVSTASHEFRTPLSSILSSVDLISMYSSEEQSDKREKHIGRIRASVKNLTNILNDFLSLGKIEEGKLNVHFSEFQVNEIFEAVSEDLRFLGSPSQNIQFEVNGEEKTIKTDRSLLSNVLVNLLNNALKYSEEDVYCNVEIDSRQIKISVRDQGIGIPKEDQKFLFTRFFRATNAENWQGTGLGLSIVKKHLELLNGNITFESQLGKGTVFTFKIPQAK